jgi:hypothetical protein
MVSRLRWVSALCSAILFVSGGLVWAAHWWFVVSVDSPPAAAVGDVNCTVLDGSGYPHIAYDDFVNEDLKYAYWDGSQWVIEVADSGTKVAVGLSLSLDLDSTGKAHISYYQGVGYQDLKHARRDGPNTWFVEAVDTGGNVGSYNSLKVDSGDRVHVAYYDLTNRHLKYALRDAGGWHIETVDTADYTGALCSLALDSLGRPHIAYNDNVTATLGIKYAWWNGSGWVWRPSIGNGTGAYLILDSGDVAHLSYFDRTSKALLHAVWGGTSWNTETVDATVNTPGPAKMAIGADDRVQIAYTTSLPGELKLAVKTGGTWDIETVYNLGPVGYSPSLVVGAASDPQITFWRYDLGNLWYTATRGPLAARWPR